MAGEATFHAIVLKSDGSLDCMGKPISFAELALLVLIPACVARLNIWGMRDLARPDDEPLSGGCVC